MILCQLDDFSVSATAQQDCQDIIRQIGTHLKVPLNDLGIIRKFNGVNIQQTKWYIKISCEEYLMKILMKHEWLQLKASNLPVPMRRVIQNISGNLNGRTSDDTRGSTQHPKTSRLLFSDDDW